VEDLKALQTQVTLARFPELAKQSPIWLAPGTNLDRWAKVDIDELSRLNNLEQKLIDQLIKTGGAKAVQVEEEKKDARGAQAAPKKAEPGAKPEERDPAKAARIASLQKELLDVRAKIAELRTKYEQAEAAPDPKDPAGKAKPAPAPKPPAAPETDADRERRRREEALKPIPLLVHDLNVQPGETYRYRLRTVLLNPVFQEANLIKRHPELAKMGALLGLASEPTPATPPVQIPERHYMFATKVADKSSRVTTEVWHLFNGKWRAEQFGPVTPGDPVGGRVQVKDSGFDVVVDLTLPYLLVDVNAVGSLGVEGTRYEVLFLDQRSSQVLSRDPRAELTNSLRQQLSNQQQGGPIALAR
jgi:hypothetical protein